MNKIIAIKTSGGCMRPAIKSGDIVMIEKGKQPRAGDCVLFESGERNLLHRALYVGSGGALLADDAGLTPAVFVSRDSIVGVYRVFPAGYAGVIYSFCARAFFNLGRALKNRLAPFVNRSNPVFYEEK